MVRLQLLALGAAQAAAGRALSSDRAACGVGSRVAINRVQVVLAGIMLINSRVDGFMLVMLLPVATRIVSRQLERNYGRLAASLPLEQCWQAGDTPPPPSRSLEIARDRSGSLEIARDRSRSRSLARDHTRSLSLEITRDHPREITRDRDARRWTC